MVVIASNRPRPITFQWRGALARIVVIWFCFTTLVSSLNAAEAWRAGDKVSVLWGGKWYPASVLEVKDAKFKIHYDGYGSNWDEWVTAGRLRNSTTPPVAAPANSRWKVGDKVDAWNVTWYPAEIMVVGVDEHAGQFKVHYESFSGASDQWLKVANIRDRRGEKSPADTVASKAAADSGPRLGKYGVYSYGAPPNRIYLGDIVLLSDGRYRALQPGGTLLGEGGYRFDAAKTTVIWVGGPYDRPEWGGGFEISREGKTHTIRLRRGTIATNSTD